MKESSGPDARKRLLPYVGQLDRRSPDDIDLLVVHCTELPDLETAREYGERILYPQTGTGNSGHYYIDRDGTIELWVPESRIAHHVRAYNPRSIGVELVNTGRYPNWFDSRHQRMQEEYPETQIQALLRLIEGLSCCLPSLRLIAGHDDLDLGFVPSSDDPAARVRRKNDPGELFPWPDVLAACGLGRYQPETANAG